MKPHSRRKSPIRIELPADIASSFKESLTPLPRRITSDNVAQEETAKHSRASHYTISRDETSLGSSGRDKLVAMRKAGNNGQYQEQYQDSPDTSLGSGLTKRNKSIDWSEEDLVTLKNASDRRQNERLQVSSNILGFQHTIPGSKPDSLVLLLQEKAKELQSENERLLHRLKRENKPDVDFEVLHHISREAGTETYLDEPYWAKTSNGIQLKANSPILYPDAYIQYKSLDFTVERYYSADKEAPEIIEALRQNRIPNAVHLVEHIRPVSDGMREAMQHLKNSEDPRKIPGILKDEVMVAPYYWWYYYRDQPDIFDNLSPPLAKLIRNLTDWIDANYGKLYSQVDGQFERGMVSIASLRFLIRPGDVLVHVDQDSVEAYLASSSIEAVYKGDLRVGISDENSGDVDEFNRLYVAAPPTAKGQQEWEVGAWSYGYNGQFFKETKRLSIKFSDDIENVEMPTRNLSVFPIRYASHAAGQRYMIDYPTYQELHPQARNMRAFLPDSKVEPTFIEQEVPSEPDIYVLPRTILGFNLRRKKWEDLNVDHIREVSWNKDAFSHLVADPETKELVQALVTNKVAAEKGTDLMQNKGNGLIMLLHGGPGTGKTFTAESVAEMAEKPLYPVTCGDIGIKPEDVEKYLESVFYLGKRWGCVVLLDEAEVFLEQRSLSDLARNALVSVFLRALEYYDGILILTSNRVGTFDEAFKSRIQLALHYEPLTQPRRAQIWHNFFRRLKSLEEDNIDYDDVENYIGELSEQEMNGRQIRNVITTARQWAQFQGKTMMASHLKYAIKVTSKFDAYIKDVKEGFSDDQIARGDGVR
ncbi:hypothetical protein ACHAPX_009993 [Trichoderma viride]